jgi:hypothetical protein
MVGADPKKRLEAYYNMSSGDPELDELKTKFKSFGYGPSVNLTDSNNSGTAAMLAKKANGGLIGKAVFPKKANGGPDEPVTTATTDLKEFTVHGFKDKGTRNFYNNINEEAPRVHYALMKMGEKYGFTKVETVRGEKKITVGGRNTNAAADYTPGLNRIRIYQNFTGDHKTVYHQARNIIDELPHKIQYDKAPVRSYLRSVAGMIGSAVTGINNYDTPGTFEHEAHNVIEPKLVKEYKDLINKKTDNAYGRKFKLGGKIKKVY